MRICKLAFNQFAPDARIYKEAETLANAGHEVTVLALAGGNLPQEETIGEIRIVRLRLAGIRVNGGRYRLDLSGCIARVGRVLREIVSPLAYIAAVLCWPARITWIVLESIWPSSSRFRRLAGRVLRKAWRLVKAPLRLARRVLRKAWRLVKAPLRLAGRVLRKAWRLVRASLRHAGACVRRAKWGKALSLRILQRAYARAVVAEVRRIKPAVVHAHDLLTLYAGVRAAHEVDAGLIYDAHEIEWDRCSFQRNWVLRTWWRFQEAALISAVDSVVTVSPRIGELYRRRYCLGQPVIVPNLPHRAWAQATPEIDLRLEIPEGSRKRILVYLGTVTDDRGVPQTLQALSHLPEDYVLVTLGNIAPNVEAQLRAKAETLGVQSRFFTLPPVHYTQVSLVSSCADVGVVPVQPVGTSYRYCMPNKLFELIHAGITMVVGKLPDVEAIVEGNRLGEVCDQESPESIAAAVLRVSRPATRRAIVRRVDAVRAAYSWESFEPRLLQLYETISADTSRRKRWRWALPWLRPHVWWLALRTGPHPAEADAFAGLQPPNLEPLRRPRPARTPHSPIGKELSRT